MDVVGNEYQGAFVAFQRGNEGVDREDIKVGGRLIHEQQVRRIDEEFHQVQTRLLATGKNGDALFHIGAAEQERPENGPCLVLAQGRAGGHHFFQHGVIFIQ